MVDYTSMAMLNGEVFTEENPAFVKVLNELDLSDVQINNIINAINKYSEEDNASLKDISNSLSKIEFDSLMSLFNINNRALNTISNDMKDIRDNIKDESIITNFPDDYPDKDVKTELELIKQGVKENKETNQLILDRLDGTIDTQVTGSNVENRKTETILSRRISRTRWNSASFTQPKWANYAIFTLNVYGVTGTFSEGQGIRLETIIYPIDSNYYYGGIHEVVDEPNTSQMIEWGRGIDDDVFVSDRMMYICLNNTFVSELGSSVRARISGDFDEGDGFDFEIKVTWIKG